jgi:hypothetical protein
MGRHLLIVAAVVLASPNAQAQTQALTLACKGTVQSGTDEKPVPTSMGIILNFTTRTVQGFGYPGVIDIPVRIKAANDVTISFGGSEVMGSSRLSIMGSLDRVTGDVNASTMHTDEKTNQTIGTTNYELKCVPTQRMF